MTRAVLGLAFIVGLTAVQLRADDGGGFDRAIHSALPRVVKLYGLGAGSQVGYGSGVIVSKDGLVVTVYSLLIDARNVRAITADGSRYRAVVVHRDADRQLALLRLVREQAFDEHGHPIAKDRSVRPPRRTPEDLSPLEFPYFDVSAAAEPRPGDWVLAAGNAFRIASGAEPVTVAHGVFSVRTRLDARRRVKDFPYRGEVLVIDSITNNPGMPGGALVDLDGRLLGMIGREVISNQTHTHLNYAVPRDVLAEFIAEALRSARGKEETPIESVTDESKPRDLGIRIAKAGYRKVLPFVERVARGSSAARAGLRADDLILSINGRQVPDADTYNQIVAAIAADEPVELVIRRDRQIKSIRIEAPAP